MNRMRLLILSAALIAGLLAAYLAAGLLQRPEPQAAAPSIPKSDTEDVLVAGRDLAAGEKIGTGGLEWRPWPVAGVAPEMITRDEMPGPLDRLQAARARVGIVAGEPILPAKIVATGEAGFMSALLPEGRRAMSIQISELSSVSGFVLPNDRVDVIFTRQVTDSLGNRAAMSDAVLTNVKVLAINQTTGVAGESAALPDARTAVLELEPKQAEVLARIASAGQLSLVLRSFDDKASDKPMLADAYRYPNRATSGPLIVRYGLERSLRVQ